MSISKRLELKAEEIRARPMRDIRGLAEEIVRALSEAGDWFEGDWLRDQEIDRWEARIRSALPELSGVLGELAVAQAALHEIAHGAPTGHPYATADETLQEKVEQAKAALSSESGRLAGELIRASIELDASLQGGRYRRRTPATSRASR